MRVLMLSWEYPPHCVGGLAQHVYELSAALAEEGVEVAVITAAESDALPASETVRGVEAHRVRPYHGASLNFITWALQLNLAMLEKGIVLLREKEFDIVHAHDWLSAYAARGLKHAYHLPLVATIHATEYGRNHGLHTDEQRFISDIEWWLTYEAWRVICCSQYMREELQHVFHTPEDKIKVLPNGILPKAYQVSEPDRGLRRRFAADDEQIVFFVGRLVQEKGVQVLLEAVPLIIEQFPRTKFIIAGRGPYEEELHSHCDRLGLRERVNFTGYIDDRTRNHLYHFAACAVFPSLYEPFGTVALEGMAARTPVVVSDTGGLSEIVNHNENGLKAYCGNARSLADQIRRLLSDQKLARRLGEAGYQTVLENYSWQGIARNTALEYKRILSSPQAYQWRNSAAAPRTNLFSHFGRYDH